jgi:hypothetical protein
VRGESRFSDHRPVYSIFTAEVQFPSPTHFSGITHSNSAMGVDELPYPTQFSGITPSNSAMGVDELPYPTYPHSYMDINFY